MTNSEFSDTFTTLLNSYNTQASFGEQASKREIVLDEYEKSVLLTQAQDIIVKSYFDSSMNQQGQGFDDSTRRQMDFSSLIKVASLEPKKDTSDANVDTVPEYTETFKFDDRGLIFELPRREGNSKTTEVLFILNEKLTWTPKNAYWGHHKYANYTGAYTDAAVKAANGGQGLQMSDSFTTAVNGSTIIQVPAKYAQDIADAEKAGWIWHNAISREYVIVPISYKEYDREMSKPYAQPLKKQAWRLFQNQAVGFDVNTELIPRFNVGPKDTNGKHKYEDVVGANGEFKYKIRYVKRPRPIILEDLPNGLEIDGYTGESSCELNPIAHMDILNKAVDLAIATRGGGAAERGITPNNSMQKQW